MRQLNIKINQIAKSECNILDVLRDHLTETQYAFTKTGGSVRSPRATWIQFVNTEKRERKLELEANGQTDVKVSQYDAMRHFIQRNQDEIQPDVEGKLYKFVDKLANVLPNVKGRPTKMDAFACLTILAEDWANNPNNIYCDWDEIASAADLSDIESD